MNASPSADDVLQRAVARTKQDEARAGQFGYTYTKVNVTEELDGAGKVKEHKEKVYQISFQDGATHARLLKVNGRPPAEADLKKQAENEMTLQQLLGQPKTTKGDNRESFLTPELVARFQFTVVGQAAIEGRMAYQVTFQPKSPEAPVHHMVDRLLNRISGTLWIDAQEFEVARADVRLRSEVSFLGGALGCLKKLAFTMTRTRVADGLWLNSSSRGDFEGRKLLDLMRIKTKSQCSNFQPLA